MQIENFRENLPGSAPVAQFDLYIPALKMTIHNIKVVRSKKGHLFHSMPSYKETSPDGQVKFRPYLSFCPEKQAEFDLAVKRLLEPFVAGL